MRDVLPELLGWWQAGHTVGVGTVVETWGSSPRPPGATMLVGPGGVTVGSVSGGCVEGAVYDLCESVIANGLPLLEKFGVSDDDAFVAGLTCGGTMEVFVGHINQRNFPELGQVAEAITAGRPVAIATVIEHPDPSWVGRRLVVGLGHGQSSGKLSSSRADAVVTDDARGLLAADRTVMLTYGPNGERRGIGMRVFVSSFVPRPRMVVFGAIDFAAAVAEVGAFLGYRVTVCDARPAFATANRFPSADEVIVEWPHRYLEKERDAGRLDERTVICVLTHDPKFDVPVLKIALRLPASAYVGAMGSRRTHEDRVARLRSAGLNEEELSRLSSPIGLDLGGRTPEETAVSIAAEVIALQRGGGGNRLTRLDGPIHYRGRTL